MAERTTEEYMALLNNIQMSSDMRVLFRDLILLIDPDGVNAVRDDLEDRK